MAPCSTSGCTQQKQQQQWTPNPRGNLMTTQERRLYNHCYTTRHLKFLPTTASGTTTRCAFRVYEQFTDMRVTMRNLVYMQEA